jgi:hypothetical protein
MNALPLDMLASPAPSVRQEEAAVMIRLEGISKDYGNFTALRQTDICVRRGELPPWVMLQNFKAGECHRKMGLCLEHRPPAIRA